MNNYKGILNQFGRRIRELRIQRGLTSQMSLAHRAHLDRTYIGGVERGERNIGLKNIEKIAAALDMSLEELFKNL